MSIFESLIDNNRRLNTIVEGQRVQGVEFAVNFNTLHSPLHPLPYFICPSQHKILNPHNVRGPQFTRGRQDPWHCEDENYYQFIFIVSVSVGYLFIFGSFSFNWLSRKHGYQTLRKCINLISCLTVWSCSVSFISFLKRITK